MENDQAPDKIYGDDSALFARISRGAHEGKSFGKITLLGMTNNLRKDHMLLVGAFAFTKSNRFIFWPVLPWSGNTTEKLSGDGYLDHLTIQFPNQKMHITAYDEFGKSIHKSGGWGLYFRSNGSMGECFTYVVSHSLLEKQEDKSYRIQCLSNNEAERRINLSADFFDSLVGQRLTIPESKDSSRYYFFQFYISDNPKEHVEKHINSLGGLYIPFYKFVDINPDDLQKSSASMVSPTIIALPGNKSLIVASMMPPGKPKGELTLGLPTKEYGVTDLKVYGY
jgi:hypothetical protein